MESLDVLPLYFLLMPDLFKSIPAIRCLHLLSLPPPKMLNCLPSLLVKTVASGQTPWRGSVPKEVTVKKLSLVRQLVITFSKARSYSTSHFSSSLAYSERMCG